jgi:hypothetical protein
VLSTHSAVGGRAGCAAAAFGWSEGVEVEFELAVAVVEFDDDAAVAAEAFQLGTACRDLVHVAAPKALAGGEDGVLPGLRLDREARPAGIEPATVGLEVHTEWWSVPSGLSLLSVWTSPVS